MHKSNHWSDSTQQGANCSHNTSFECSQVQCVSKAPHLDLKTTNDTSLFHMGSIADGDSSCFSIKISFLQNYSQFCWQGLTSVTTPRYSIRRTLDCISHPLRKWTVTVKYGLIALEVQPSAVRPTALGESSWLCSFPSSISCQAGTRRSLMVCLLGTVYVGFISWSSALKAGDWTVE